MALAVWAAAAIVPGIQYDSGQSILIAALVLGILNAFVKPALNILSLRVMGVEKVETRQDLDTLARRLVNLGL